MPTTSRSRTIEAPAQELWRTVSDPHHLPRWWPRVTRMEDVREDAFTQVLTTAKGKPVRADFRVRSRDDEQLTLVWEQLVEGTPFAEVLSAAETQLTLARVAPDATAVTLELRQTLSRGSRSRALGVLVPRFGSLIVARAAARTLDGALDGLVQISG